MSVRLFNVAGAGYVIGETIKDDKHDHRAPHVHCLGADGMCSTKPTGPDVVHLKYPAIIVLQRDPRNPAHVQIHMNDLVPPLFRDAHRMMERFPLLKRNIVFRGKPSDEILKQYEGYQKSAIQRFTGISLHGADALSKLPPMADGRN